MENKTILFICKANSGRSQIAEAFFNSLSKKNKTISAGTNPDEKIHPWTVEVMKEAGIKVIIMEIERKVSRLIKEMN